MVEKPCSYMILFRFQSGVEIEPAFDKNEMNVWREDHLMKRQILFPLKQWTSKLIHEDKLSDLRKNCDPRFAKILFSDEFDRKNLEFDIEALIKSVAEER
jgi:hypothetical protein